VKLNPSNKELYTDSGTFLKRLHCPVSVMWKDLMENGSNTRACRVLINNVITNHVSGRWNQGDVYRLSKSESIWTGRYFDIDVRSYAFGEFIG